MKKITESKLERSKEYIWSNCSELSQALFTHFLERRDVAGVMHALSAYQNEDGGFGHNLEGDFDLPDSSPLATSVAFQILTSTDAPPDRPIVDKGIQYLVNNYQPERKGWITVPAEVNHYPHADWWHFLTSEGGTVIDRNWGNPTAELVGYLLRYPRNVPVDLLVAAYQNALRYLKDYSGEMEMHELFCFLRLADNMPDEDFKSVQKQLTGLVLGTVKTNPGDWRSYAAQPLDFVHEPGSFLYEPLKQAVHTNLDYWIESMQPNGVWQPVWSWDQYPEAWQKAKIQIAGRMTVNRLNILKRFNRLAR